MTQNRDSTTPPFVGRLPHISGGVILQPKADAPAPRKSRKKKLPKVITAQEAEALLASIGAEPFVGPRNRLMVELMYRAGLRVSEVVALRPRDVEADGVIRLYDAKGGDGTAYFPADELAAQLTAWLRQRSSWQVLTYPTTVSGILFIKPDGSSISVRYIQRFIKAHREKLGITGIVTPHVFRHTFATQMLEEGFQLTEVQSALRHANLATTAVYLHVRDESLRRKMTRRSRPSSPREEV